MEEKNKIEYTIPFKELPKKSISMLIGILLSVTPFTMIYGWSELWGLVKMFFSIPEFILTIVIGTILHEGIHLMGWGIVGQVPLNKLKVGFNSKTMTPFASCKIPINRNAYLAGTIMPGLILGIIPYFLGLVVIKSLFIYGIYFMIAAAGDFTMVSLISQVPQSYLIEDHPEKVGFWAIKKE
jgi:hypothetical protein